MSVESLTGTQWKLNPTVSLDHEFSFEIDGAVVSQYGGDIRRIKCAYNSRYDYYYLQAISPSGSILNLSSRDYSTSPDYRDIVFYNGIDSSNSDFISFLEANATRVSNIIYKAFAYSIRATADAIRSKGETNDSITWTKNGGFKDAVAGIVIGKDGNVFPHEIVDEKIAYAKNNKIIGTLQNASGRSF